MLKLLIVALMGSLAVQAYDQKSDNHSSKCPKKPVKVKGAKESISVNFEAFATGNPNGQFGWTRLGNYDHEIATQSRYPTFGTKSLRISNAITSGSFDQTYTKQLTNSVGESSASTGAFLPGTRRKRFVMEFDVGSTLSTYQPGLHAEVSPDRGDGARMSFVRFEDGPNGINVWFSDVQGITQCGSQTDHDFAPCANFVDKLIAKNLKRNKAHRIKIDITVKNGPSNDVVDVYVDCKKVHTGTTWEDYYYFDPESNDGGSRSRIIKGAIFMTRARYGTESANDNNGFLFDNVVMSII